MESDYWVHSRFMFYHYCFYIAGVPLCNTSVSIFYHAFVLLCYVSISSTLLAMFLELHYYVQDLDGSIDVVAVLLLFLAASYAQLYLR
jgi:hypothetical protein